MSDGRGAAVSETPVRPVTRAAAPGGEAVRASGLLKAYEGGRIVAVNRVDLRVAAGEHVAVVGPSGCGKSTLLNLVAALDRPDAGELEVFGRSLATLTVRETDRFRATTIGFVFQLHNLMPHLTAHENVQVPMLRPGGAGARERCERATMLLERVGLGERMTNLPTTLSGGERQRVAVARALANRPRLLLADEPTGALDTRSGGQVLELLARIRAEDGVTLVVVTHDATVASSAERIIRMRDGCVEAE